MCLFFSLVPATAWLAIGFFILFAAARAEGPLQSFGRVLGVWAFAIALLFPIMGAYVTISGLCPMETMMGALQPPAAP